ncbi:MAG TPA: hypothetical protein VLL08_32955 [Kineosporiaceae bacterium]|nr:hypothetical protein [Kineosporiaceae bacterium]
MASKTGHPTKSRSNLTLINQTDNPPAGELLRGSAFFVVANEREIAGVHHRVQILLGAWQLRRLAETAAELVGALVVATIPFPGRQAHVRLRAYQTRMRCEVSGMYPAESAHGPAAQLFTLSEPGEAVTLLADRSAAWGHQDFRWGRTFWFELELPTHP